ncbi:uncharacterized protein METZ01_LOCUS453490 [marine metagenome]|uniref:SHSP domain-containing protein n=1 Tax=marine metagenome TaxID=408172 RepID=A0A382ZYB4_9ZZZZ
MTLINQPKDLFHLRRDFSRLFDSFRGHIISENETPVANWRPVVDIDEKSEEYIIAAELPGMEKDSIDVTVADGRLTIKGVKKQGTQSEYENVHRVERRYGSFVRSFDLPSAVDAESISAEYRDGVLKVMVPKAEEAKAQQIEVSMA